MNPTAPKTPLDQLQAAKAHSDRRDYGSKHRLIRNLMTERPDEFKIDSQEGDILGITHIPTGFRLHVPRLVVPTPKPEPIKTASWQDPDWKTVPIWSVKYAVAVAPVAESLKEEPYEGDVWVSPETGEIRMAALGDYPDVTNEPWVRVKQALTVGEVLSPIGPLINQTPFSFDTAGGPRPVASMLAGGLVGAGLGYAGGRLAEYLMPGTFTPGAAKTRAALLGGLMGATPGALGMGLNHLEGKSVFDKAASWRKTCSLILQDLELPDVLKFAANIFRPVIDVAQFNNAIWQDPFSPQSTQAVASGLVYGAGVSKNSPIVSPMDVARMAVGMGTGYASATLVGKTFGALAGLSPDAQRALQTAGIWSGIVKTVMDPIARTV